MKKVLKREKSGYTLGIVFCLVGLILLAVAFWRVWLHASASQLVLSDLWPYLWTEQLDLAFGVKFKLIYFTLSAVVIFFAGSMMLALSQKWFTLSGETVLLMCPYCKNHWRTSRAKGWAECPHCRQFIQPQVIKRS